MAYGITITTKATIAGVSYKFPLCAEITDLQPGDDLLTVEWTADNPAAVFLHNNQLVVPDAFSTDGTNSGTQMAAAITGTAVSFTAKLMRDGVAIATSAPHSVTFKPLSASFQFITDKLFAPTVAGGAVGPANLITAILTVTDATGNPVEGAEVQWRTLPKTDSFSVYQDSAGTTRALTDGEEQYTLSAATTGEATAYLADPRTHQYSLLPTVLGCDVSRQTTIIFAGTGSEPSIYPPFVIPGLESDSYSQQYLNIIDDQTTFTAVVPGDAITTARKHDLFYVLLNESIVIDGTIDHVAGGVDITYAVLRSPVKHAGNNIPSAQINSLTFFIQDSIYGNVGMSKPVLFYGLGDWSGNKPEDSPVIDRILPLAQIVPKPRSGIITTDTIDADDGLTIYIPALNAAYTNKPISVLFYLNGYSQDVPDEEKHGNPEMPGLTIKGRTAANGTIIKLPYNMIFGYGSYLKANRLSSCVDYYVELDQGPGSRRYYSRYPTAYGTNTVYP